jgi:hypothetical protein
MQNQKLFLLDPDFGYPFARIVTSASTKAITSAVAVACAEHFDKPVQQVNTTFLEVHSTLNIIFKDGTDVYIDVDFDEPYGEDDNPKPF